MSRSPLIIGSLVLFGAAALLDSNVARAAADDYSVVPTQFIYCTTCHGVELKGDVAVDAPRLNGMEDWYVRSQLEAFKSGRRGTHAQDPIGMEMQPQAAILSEEAIGKAAAFVAATPVRGDTIAHTVTGDAARGATLYASCAACHGADGKGSKVLGAPGLAGQSDWYLVRQLDKYAIGARGYAENDTAGQQMRAAVTVLGSEQDVADVVAYINTFTENTETP
jgi:cytochrome c oxidase subunit 2